MKRFLTIKNVLVVAVVLLIISVFLSVMLYQSQHKYITASENQYNMYFSELVNYMQNVESYLAKSLISTSHKHGAETLTNLWRESNLAQTYLSMLPIESQELENTQKFLNQVSDYSYALSRKNINEENLNEEDFNNLKELHNYSLDLKNTLNQLSDDINSGRITWGELTRKGTVAFAQQVDNISQDTFKNLEENFHQYSGLIYDGAFSEHLLNGAKKALIGSDIGEEEAKEKVKEFVGESIIKDINSLGISENSDISGYNFSITTRDDNNINIAISQKGGHIIRMNSNRSVTEEKISQDEANEKGKEFLNQKGFPNMKETYYLKQDGVVTINYAYEQDGVVMYPDLIKVKVALDNGEILGVETTNYLNSHCNRDITNIKISKEEAKLKLNKDLNIQSEGLAVVPTKWQTEILCYEFKGKVDDTDFLVYINCETGEEQDILIITNTPNGILTM